MKLDDDIHNYYEQLVLDRINKLELDKTKSRDFLADLCCLTLNQLTPRYIRFEVDLSFYMPEDERIKMQESVDSAMDKALEFMENRFNGRNEHEFEY